MSDQPRYPKVAPGTRCFYCGNILHGYPCIHHRDDCPILTRRDRGVAMSDRAFVIGYVAIVIALALWTTIR